jgi:hypothetical protein
MGGAGGSTTRCWTAKRASSSRLKAPPPKIWVRWCLAVSSVRANLRAISLLLNPATAADVISSSRVDRPNRSRAGFSAVHP